MLARVGAIFRALVISFVVIAVEASLSGLYIDNGLDQTVIHHFMTPRERMVVEHEILDLLGLPNRPKRAKSAPLDKSAPSFLLDVYKSLAEEKDLSRPTRSSELTLSGEEQQFIDESDVIMTFQSKNHKFETLRHGSGRHIWFDISEVPEEEDLVSAELRLYQSVLESKDDNFTSAKIYTISVNKIINVDEQEGLEFAEVTSTNTSTVSEGWLELNITSTFREWLAYRGSNKGLYIVVRAVDEPDVEIKPDHIGLVTPKGKEGKQPFLAAFFRARPVPANRGDRVSRKKRQASKRSGTSDNYARNPLKDMSSHWTSRSCQIQTLYVSFKDLEWQDWIIAPDGYGAFYCSGECNFPLNAHMNATNHAIVQTLVHLLNPTQVPKPCCAPTKLTPISVLYFTDDSNVILRKYKNMVVKSCGCH